MDALNSIELILKTPNQQIDDIQLKCNEEWTVRMLKDHLQNVYPSKPVSNLIFPVSSYYQFFHIQDMMYDCIIAKACLLLNPELAMLFLRIIEYKLLAAPAVVLP